jgi:hypothetical protein
VSLSVTGTGMNNDTLTLCIAVGALAVWAVFLDWLIWRVSRTTRELFARFPAKCPWPRGKDYRFALAQLYMQGRTAPVRALLYVAATEEGLWARYHYSTGPLLFPRRTMFLPWSVLGESRAAFAGPRWWARSALVPVADTDACLLFSLGGWRRISSILPVGSSQTPLLGIELGGERYGRDLGGRRPLWAQWPPWFESTPEGTKAVWRFIVAMHSIYLLLALPLLIAGPIIGVPVAAYCAIVVCICGRHLIACGNKGCPILGKKQRAVLLLLPFWGPVALWAVLMSVLLLAERLLPGCMY